MISAKRLTKAELQKKIAQIRSRMAAETTPFAEASEEARKRRIERARKDKLYFFQTYLPHYFDKAFAPFHEELAAFAEVKNEPALIAAPREHAKSTVCSLGIPLHDICFEIKHLIVLISDTEDLAADFTTFIKLEIEENPRIRQDFGDLKGRAGSWADNDFTTKNGIRVKARGRGQKIRGLRNRQYRPDRVIVDDLENDKNVRNPRLVKETIDWLLEAVLGSLADGFSFLMVGNLLAKKSVLAQLIAAKDDQDQPRFASRVYKAIGEDGAPLWPAAWPMERLERRRRHQGSLSFFKEMQNEPRDEEGLFQETWIRYYHPTEIIGVPLAIYSYLDPSSESGHSNDYKALITIGVSPEGIIYCLDAFIRHCTPNTMVQVAYSRYEEYHPLEIGAEENALGEFLMSPFEMMAKEKGYHLPLKGEKHAINKEARIGRLSPYVERGILRFCKGHSDQDLLVEHLIYFPSPTVNDDGPDGLEGAVSLAVRYVVPAGGEVEAEAGYYHADRRGRFGRRLAVA
ncbi:MAG: hypothetical protein HY760_00550 [Nitrospirae bacterium]|nr:hypothetical protein [Nitrospirota bacterium]